MKTPTALQCARETDCVIDSLLMEQGVTRALELDARCRCGMADPANLPNPPTMGAHQALVLRRGVVDGAQFSSLLASQPIGMRIFVVLDEAVRPVLWLAERNGLVVRATSHPDLYWLHKTRRTKPTAWKPYPPVRRGEPLRIKAMNGIGDSVWLAVMLANAKRDLAIPRIEVAMQLTDTHRDRRAESFLRRFDFIDKVTSERFEIFDDPPVRDGRVRYIPQGYDDEGRYVLLTGACLEWGGRIESAMDQQVEADHDVMLNHFRQHVGGTRIANRMVRESDYAVLHLGNVHDNYIAGMNYGPLWGAEDWRMLIRMMRLSMGMPVYLVGGLDDAPYHAIVMQGLNLDGVHDLAGRHSVLESVEILRRARVVVGFTSGITITSTYLRVPTIMFWRPEGLTQDPMSRWWYSDNFATNWVPPDMLESGRYCPAWYCVDTAETVAAAAKRIMQ